MDALMAAFVAALLAQASDRTPWLTAILSTRFARPGTIIVATAIALAAGNGVAAIGGMMIGPHMPPMPATCSLRLRCSLPAGRPCSRSSRPTGCRAGGSAPS